MKRIKTILLTTVITIVAASLFPHAAIAETCKEWIAKVVSVQGSVQSRKAGEKQWLPVKLNDTFCPGDMIRVLERSRAAIVLINQPSLRLNQDTTVTFNGIEKGIEKETSLIDLLKGAVHFFSRFPRSLKVVTPFVNAAVEGTEFYVRVDTDKTFLSVFEGQVSASNKAGSITLTGCQSAIAEADKAPVLQVVVRPRDAVQWALYYPPVIYRYEEFKEDDPRLHTNRASLLLSVGQVEEAKAEIEKAFNLDPNNSHAFALQSVITVTQNEKEKALILAKSAVEMDPNSASARIALSYAQQSNFDLKGALSSLQDAVKLEPENALAWARLAELYMSLGELDKALEAANRAVSLNPDLSRTQTVLGYAYLTQIKTRESKEAFEKAIELDQADPLPRLGLGLAKIRDGELKEGRREIEIAVSLDPDNSLIRSYLGKSYYEEKRDKLAEDQFGMAESFDPSDPTPFFYDAIRKQTINRPVEALHDMQKAIELNDNRAVYRSKLLLDSDLAARSASLGRIYTDLGFQQLALVEGWKSVNLDPGDFSGHRFLADSYSALPRHEIARVSELLQSQLLQPINITPVQPHLAESNLFILDGAGPADLSFNEFNPLFNRNRFALQASSILGENSTFGDELVFSGIQGRASFSIGQFHYETDGFRENNDQRQDIYNAFLQLSLSHNTSIQTEFRYRDIESGDLSLNFWPDNFLPNLRLEDEARSVRIGFRHSFSPGSEIISSFSYQDEDTDLHDEPEPSEVFDWKTDDDSYGGEFQHLFRSDYINIISGAGYFNIDRRETIDAEVVESDIHHANLYLYSYLNFIKTVTFTVGGSADFFEGSDVDRDQFNPKFGINWDILPNTTIRASAFRTLKRTFINNQSIEPTQVAGFNQFFDDVEGTEAWRYGIAIDQKFSKDIYGGVEYSKRCLEVPYTFIEIPPPPPGPPPPGPPPPPPPSEIRKADWEEHLGRAYLYLTPYKWLALNAEFQYEKFGRDREFVAGIERVETYRVPLGINFYHPSGFSARLKATYIDQDGKFLPQNLPPGSQSIPGSDQFWIFDASLSYRLSKRMGFLTIGAKNLFDKSFNYQDTNPVSPIIIPDRLVFFRFTIVL